MNFLKLWDYSTKALRTEGLLPTPIVAQREGKLRVDSAGLNLLGFAYFFDPEVFFAQDAPYTLVAVEKEQHL